MERELIPLHDGLLSELLNREKVKSSSIFKVILNVNFLLRKRTKNYFGAYFVSIFLIILYLLLSMVPTTQNGDDPNPAKFDYANELESTRIAFKSNNSYLFLSPNTSFTQLIAKQMFQSENYHVFNTIDELSDRIQTINLSLTDYLFGLHAEDNQTYTSIVSSSSYMYSPLTFTNALIEYISNQNMSLNNSFAFSSRSFAHPPNSFSVSAASIGTIYFLFGKALVVVASILIYFELNSNKILFLFNIYGVTTKISAITYFFIIFIEHLPLNIIILVLFCFIGKYSSGTNPLLFLISLYLFDISLYSIQIFFQPLLHSKGSSSIFSGIFLLLTALLEYIFIFQEYIPTILYKILLFVFPPTSFSSLCDLMIRRKESLGTMSFGDLDYTFNNISASMSLLALSFSSILYFLLSLLGILCNSNLFGKPPIGWKNLFKPQYWKKLFAKHYSVSDFEQRTNNEAIKFENIVKIYKGKVITKALDNVTLTINSGEIIIAIGSNGSGKSTLVSSLIGAQDINNGSISFFGKELLNNFDSIFYPFLGVVFQDNTLINCLTAREHLMIFCSLCGLSKDQAESQVRYYGNMLKINDFLDTQTVNLSGGNKRKLCVILAILKHPLFIILDEPTAGVDSISRQLIWKAINELSGVTALITTHSIEESESISSRILVMSKGHIAFVGTPAELREQYHCCYYLTIIDENTDMQRVLQFSKNLDPNIKIQPEHGNTLMIPNNLNFSDILNAIDAHKNELGFSNYTVHVENLEETMKKIMEDEEALIQ